MTTRGNNNTVPAPNASDEPWLPGLFAQEGTVADSEEGNELGGGDFGMRVRTQVPRRCGSDDAFTWGFKHPR